MQSDGATAIVIGGVVAHRCDPGRHVFGDVPADDDREARADEVTWRVGPVAREPRSCAQAARESCSVADEDQPVPTKHHQCRSRLGAQLLGPLAWLSVAFAVLLGAVVARRVPDGIVAAGGFLASIGFVVALNLVRVRRYLADRGREHHASSEATG